ncbi:uncharacterized protein PAC_03256 [Phialocephala subalpina]|uniref:Uncharacterized protein n=1 Tax=Phialocephala subalpina TaxID=576137 RepID=A0A1L7WKS0_9HELO|nr:uncharacterized protein PAC_03256 [Phialocephala subalpina]
MFPLWISIVQLLITFIFSSSTSQLEVNKKLNKDMLAIHTTTYAFSALSASVWIYTLLTAPYFLSELFLPHYISPENYTFLPLFALGFVAGCGGYEECGGCEYELGWNFGILGVAGLGAAVAAAWMWREEVLASNASALEQKDQKKM